MSQSRVRVALCFVKAFKQSRADFGMCPDLRDFRGNQLSAVGQDGFNDGQLSEVVADCGMVDKVFDFRSVFRNRLFRLTSEHPGKQERFLPQQMLRKAFREAGHAQRVDVGRRMQCRHQIEAERFKAHAVRCFDKRFQNHDQIGQDKRKTSCLRNMMHVTDQFPVEAVQVALVRFA